MLSENFNCIILLILFYFKVADFRMLFEEQIKKVPQEKDCLFKTFRVYLKKKICIRLAFFKKIFNLEKMWSK